MLRGPARAARREASARPDSATPPATVWRMSASGAPRAVDSRQEATAPGTPAAVARLAAAGRDVQVGHGWVCFQAGEQGVFAAARSDDEYSHGHDTTGTLH